MRGRVMPSDDIRLDRLHVGRRVDTSLTPAFDSGGGRGGCGLRLGACRGGCGEGVVEIVAVVIHLLIFRAGWSSSLTLWDLEGDLEVQTEGTVPMPGEGYLSPVRNSIEGVAADMHTDKAVRKDLVHVVHILQSKSMDNSLSMSGEIVDRMHNRCPSAQVAHKADMRDVLSMVVVRMDSKKRILGVAGTVLSAELGQMWVLLQMWVQDSAGLR